MHLITAQEVAGLNPAEVTLLTGDYKHVVPFLFDRLHTICAQLLLKNNNHWDQLKILNSQCNIIFLIYLSRLNTQSISGETEELYQN